MKKYLTKFHIRDIVLSIEGKIPMTKSIFVLMTLVFTIGCSETNVYESSEEGAGGSSENTSSSSNTGGNDIGGTSGNDIGGTSSTNSGSSTSIDGGGTGSPSDVFTESCIEAGERLMTGYLESYSFISDTNRATLLAHSANGTLNDINENLMTCSCPAGTFGGTALWIPGLEKTNSFVADDFSLSMFGMRLMDRFSIESYPNICGDACVDLTNVVSPTDNVCATSAGIIPVLCASTTATPAECTVYENNSTNAKASFLCCQTSNYLKLTLSTM
jgi:hypothetical protein